MPISTRLGEAEGMIGTGFARQSIRFWVFAAALAFSTIAAYSNTFHAPFVFDDIPSIVENPVIRHLRAALWPASDSTVSGRPLLSLSLAVNYAAGGTSVVGYHVANLIILVASSLALFGIARRTLVHLGNPFATDLAFSIGLIWALHPLLTESVTYVVQRAESLMGMLYLLTIYLYIRGTGGPGKSGGLWLPLSILCCYLGTLTKEVMVTVPVVIFLYDRAFITGSFKASWRERWHWFVALASAWILASVLAFSTNGRGGTAGFRTEVTVLNYALTQVHAIAHYLSLSFWPNPLVFDYGTSVIFPRVWEIGFIVGLLIAVLYMEAKNMIAGFLGVAFFVLLAPSSSILPIATETMAEHRMYLPLIPVIVAAVLVLFRIFGRATLMVCIVLSMFLFTLTFQRNKTYDSEMAIWQDAALHYPNGERAHNNLGLLISKVPGRMDEAISHYREAIRLKPGYADAHNNLGCALKEKPESASEAITQFKEALAADDQYFPAHNNLGNAYLAQKRFQEAMDEYRAALRLKPEYVEALYGLGNAFAAMGDTREAIVYYRRVIRLDPAFYLARNNLANVLFATGRTDEAIRQLREALRCEPHYVDANYNLGNILASTGNMPEAVLFLREAVRLNPMSTAAHYNLGNALRSSGKASEAESEYLEAIGLSPEFTDAHFNLGLTLSSEGRLVEAIAHFEKAVSLSPDDPSIHLNLATLLLKVGGHSEEAIFHLNRVLYFQPKNRLARSLLDSLAIEAK